MQEIFTYRRTGVTADGKVTGYFCATGVYPKFDQRLKEFGVGLPVLCIFCVDFYCCGAGY